MMSKSYCQLLFKKNLFNWWHDTILCPLQIRYNNACCNIYRLVARIWKKEGDFLKEWENCKRPWPEFSLFLNQNHTVYPKIETEFLGKLGNSNAFSAQKQVISKKRKKKVLTEIKTDFSGRSGHSNAFSGQITTSTSQLWHPISFGGLFSFFHQKSASKAPKACDFAYFTGQWGGSSPPPPWLRYWTFDVAIVQQTLPVASKSLKTPLITTSKNSIFLYLAHRR